MGRLFRPRRSVEWLNSFVKVVWPLINPDMFVSIIDMVEDVMQASLPGFVDAVKVCFLSYLQLRLGRSSMSPTSHKLRWSNGLLHLHQISRSKTLRLARTLSAS